MVFNVDSSSRVITLISTRKSTSGVDRRVGDGLSPMPTIGLRPGRVRKGGLVLLRMCPKRRAPCCCVNSGRHLTFIEVKGRSMMTSHARLGDLILGNSNHACSDLPSDCGFRSVTFSGLGSIRCGQLRHSFSSDRFIS